MISLHLEQGHLTTIIYQKPRGGAYSHILAIRVCATGEGVLFKPFDLVKGMVFKSFGLIKGMVFKPFGLVKSMIFKPFGLV